MSAPHTHTLVTFTDGSHWHVGWSDAHAIHRDGNDGPCPEHGRVPNCGWPANDTDREQLAADYADAIRWGYPGSPRPTFVQWLIEREAQQVHRERTGRGDPWPSLEDYSEASRRVRAVYTEAATA